VNDLTSVQAPPPPFVHIQRNGGMALSPPLFRAQARWPPRRFCSFFFFPLFRWKLQRAPLSLSISPCRPRKADDVAGLWCVSDCPPPFFSVGKVREIPSFCFLPLLLAAAGQDETGPSPCQPTRPLLPSSPSVGARNVNQSKARTLPPFPFFYTPVNF